MTQETNKRRSLSPEERLNKINQQKLNAYKQIIKETMGSSPKFLALKDIHLKSNKWLHEAKSIVESHDKSVETINKQLEALNEKHKIAKEAILRLENQAASYSALMESLGAELVKLIEDTSATPEQLSKSAEKLLETYMLAEGVGPVSDPFEKFRRKE